MSFIHIGNLSDFIDIKEINELRLFLKNMKWNYKVPGGFVTNFPQRKVNTFGNGQAVNDNSELINNKWNETYWTAKQTQNDISLKTSVEPLPKELLNIIPSIRMYLKRYYPEFTYNDYTFTMAVCNNYTEPNMTISAHTDDQEWYPLEIENKPIFASLTFYLEGIPNKDEHYSRFQAKLDGEWTDIKLDDNSIMIMNSSIEHRVLKHKKKDEKYFKPRINITLRSTYDVKINPLMNYLSVANHSRYYRQPLSLVVNDNYDINKINELLECYNKFCLENNYNPIIIETNSYHNNKTNLKLKYNYYIKKLKLNSIKYKANIVSESLYTVCDYLRKITND